MAFKISRKSDGDVVVCRGCKGQRWVSIVENKSYCKFVCEKCWNEHTLYIDPQVYQYSGA